MWQMIGWVGNLSLHSLGSYSWPSIRHAIISSRSSVCASTSAAHGEKNASNTKAS